MVTTYHIFHYYYKKNHIHFSIAEDQGIYFDEREINQTSSPNTGKTKNVLKKDVLHHCDSNIPSDDESLKELGNDLKKIIVNK